MCLRRHSGYILDRIHRQRLPSAFWDVLWKLPRQLAWSGPADAAVLICPDLMRQALISAL